VLHIPQFEGGGDAVMASFSSVHYAREEIEADRSLRGRAKFPGGVYVSFDGGGTWEPQNEGLPVDEAHLSELLTYHPSDPQTLYVSTVRGGYEVGAYRSADGGRSWRLITCRLGTGHNTEFGWISPDMPGLAAAQGPGLNHLTVLEVSPAEPDLLFIRASGHCGLMQSTNAGSSCPW
jgi:hypothetical protein